MEHDALPTQAVDTVVAALDDRHAPSANEPHDPAGVP
jgi:hypothetical protein